MKNLLKFESKNEVYSPVYIQLPLTSLTFRASYIRQQQSLFFIIDSVEETDGDCNSCIGYLMSWNGSKWAAFCTYMLVW